MKKALIAVLTGLILGSAGGTVSWRLLQPLDPTGQTLFVDVPAGKTFYELAEELEQKNLIRSQKEMKALIRLFGLPLLSQGEYELSSRMSLWHIFQTLKQRKDRSFPVSFPEGLNHYEMREILKSHNWPAEKDFLQAVHDKKFIKKLLNTAPASLEGYLFPDTYQLKRYMKAHTLIELMTKRFLEVYKKFSGLFTPYSLTRHQIVTLASLIEKETGQADERPLIASVFYNRLRLGKKLQTDPTILYSLYLVKGFDREKNIRKKDILFPSPYNTYTVKGLPPGPIASPGEKSLWAVFFPAKSDYLYFVSKNDGSHKFSKTYKEHEKAVYKYQIKPFKRQ